MEATNFDYEDLRHLSFPPGLQLLPGELLAHVGRTADSRVIAASNYRLFLLTVRDCEVEADIDDDNNAASGQSSSSSNLELTFCQPLGCITRLTVADAASLRLSFALPAAPLLLAFNCLPDITNWADRLDPGRSRWSASQVGAAIRASSSADLAGCYRSHFTEADLASEMKRLEMDELTGWRLATVNADYAVCASYPGLHLVPADATDEDVRLAAKFRAQGRFPSAVWRCRGNGAALARSAQPLVGLWGWRCDADEKLLRLLGNCGSSRKLLIADARTYRIAALANRSIGGGVESASYYRGAEVAFLGLPNVHAVRQSFLALQQRALSADAVGDGGSHLGELERSGWLQLVSALLCHACRLARALTVEGRSVLVHCSDGWDRTPQLTCLTLLLCDPYYRSWRGFCRLLSREWLQFGHKFATRCGVASSNGGSVANGNEWSPIFVQFLDCVHQLCRQFPTAFEFTDSLLRRLAVHCYSGLFDSVSCCNSAKERDEGQLAERSLCLWQLFELRGAQNLFYQPAQGQLSPAVGLASLTLWSELYAPLLEEQLATASKDVPPQQPTIDWDGLPVDMEPWQSHLLSLTEQLADTQQQTQQLQLQLASLAVAAASSDAATDAAAGSSPSSMTTASGGGDLLSMELIEAKEARGCFVHWVPDHQRSRCADCGAAFSKLVGRWRHHCRACGDVFCRACCGQFVDCLPDQMLGRSRVCRACLAKVVPQPQAPPSPSASAPPTQPTKLSAAAATAAAAPAPLDDSRCRITVTS